MRFRSQKYRNKPRREHAADVASAMRRLAEITGRPSDAAMLALVNDEIARGAAPALLTNQTIRELTGRA